MRIIKRILTDNIEVVDIQNAQSISETRIRSLVKNIPYKMSDLRMMTFILCAIIFVSAFCITLYSIFTYRKSRDEEASNFYKNTAIEIIWTILPFIIAILMAFPATKAVFIAKR